MKKRAKKISFENAINLTVREDHFRVVVEHLAKQINSEVFDRKYAPVKDILKLVGAGAFIAGSIAFPALPSAVKPFYSGHTDREAWKRFNIPYLKRTLERLRIQNLVKFTVKDGMESVKITDSGRKKVLKFAIDELAIQKPKHWDRTWRIICYDIPKSSQKLRDIFREYLTAWGCYPLQRSVFLHAYPCEHEVGFLAEYLGISDDVRILTVFRIENDELFRQFFGV